jgi:ABC-type antimicrobial peptide transport system permease subunit
VARALLPLFKSLLFGVSAADPAAWAAAPAALLAVALLASWLPARRATRIDPIEALKTE